MPPINIFELESDFKLRRENFSENFRLRVHRAISWLKKSSLIEDDDTKFITLWIAFNAAYAKELSNGRA